MKKREAQSVFMRVACPSCGAQVGKPCIRHSRRWRPEPALYAAHERRRRAWLQKVCPMPRNVTIAAFTVPVRYEDEQVSMTDVCALMTRVQLIVTKVAGQPVVALAYKEIRDDEGNG